MPFVHQHKVIPLERFDGDGLVTHLVLELVNVENLDGVPGKQSATVLVEQLGFDSCRLKLAQVLLARPSFGVRRRIRFSSRRRPCFSR